MQSMMTGTAEHERFSSAACHHLLPKGLSFCNVLEFANVMNLKRSLSCPTIFTLLSVESFDDLRTAECPDVHIGTGIEPWISGRWFSQIFEAEDFEGVGSLFSGNGEDIAIFRFELIGDVVHP